MTEDAHDDEIDFRELFSVLWSAKVLIISVTFFAAAVSVGYALWLPNIYQSSALLSPAEDSRSGGGVLSQYSGLANMAGISLPGGDNDAKAKLALEVLKSRAFTQEFISKHDILPELLAVDHWSARERELIIDADVYDAKTRVWIREVPAGGSTTPSAQEAYREFSKILTVSQASRTRLVTISIKHQSPDIAQQWVEWLVEDINETMRFKEIKEAEESIEYLKRQAAETSLADLDQVLFELMQAQMQRMMLAEVRREYVLSTIDPAVVPESGSEPQRSIICLFGALLGGMIGVLLSLIRHYVFKN